MSSKQRQAVLRHKRRRTIDGCALQQLLHTGGVSQQGLSAIIDKLKQGNVPMDGITRENLMTAELAAFEAVRVEERVQLIDGSEWTWELCEPSLLLSRALRASRELQTMYDAAFVASRSEAWRLAIVFDEFTPGSLHRPDNRRKCMVLGFNFLDLGMDALSQELTWMIPIIARSTKIREVLGGFSHMLKLFLRRLLFGPYGLKTAGVVLNTTRGQQQLNVLLTADLWTILADGDGLRQALDWKGANGIKPCFKHVNVLKIGSGLNGRRPNYVEGSCALPECFQRLTRHELEEFIAILKAAHERRGTVGGSNRFDQLQKCLGFNFNANGFLFDDDLRQQIDIIEVSTYDWVHTCLQDGVLNVEIEAFLGSCKRKIALNMSVVMDFMKGRFQFPRCTAVKSRNVWRLFDDYHFGGDAEKLKGQASELLGVYSLLRHFVEVRIGDRAEIAVERTSFDAACQMIDLILLAKRGCMDLNVAATSLRAAVADHLSKHKVAYGEEYLKPKHHWMFDVCDSIERDSRESDGSRQWTLIDAFVIERNNLRVHLGRRLRTTFGLAKGLVDPGPPLPQAPAWRAPTYPIPPLGRRLDEPLHIQFQACCPYKRDLM